MFVTYNRTEKTKAAVYEVHFQTNSLQLHKWDYCKAALRGVIVIKMSFAGPLSTENASRPNCFSTWIRPKWCGEKNFTAGFLFQWSWENYFFFTPECAYVRSKRILIKKIIFYKITSIYGIVWKSSFTLFFHL